MSQSCPQTVATYPINYIPYDKYVRNKTCGLITSPSLHNFFAYLTEQNRLAGCMRSGSIAQSTLGHTCAKSMSQLADSLPFKRRTAGAGNASREAPEDPSLLDPCRMRWGGVLSKHTSSWTRAI